MVIGLTGGIGSGKSTVLQMFKELGAVIYIADVEAKKLMNTDEELQLEIIKLLGDQAYSSKKLNKEYVASKVFNDTKLLQKLNALVHPKVQEHFKNFLNQHPNDIIIYEAAILFESGSNSFCDYIITVVADENVRINRLLKRDKLTKEQIKQRIQNQTDDEFKILQSNVVLKNHELEHTREQVKTIYDLVIKLQ